MLFKLPVFPASLKNSKQIFLSFIELLFLLATSPRVFYKVNHLRLVILLIMDYRTTRYTGGWRYTPPVFTSPQTPSSPYKGPWGPGGSDPQGPIGAPAPGARLDGLPTSSEALVTALSQDQDKTSTSFSQIKEKNPVNSLLFNSPPYPRPCARDQKTFEPPKAEYADQSGDTELNTGCKFYPYINILIIDSLLVESSSSISDLELLDYTTSRTLSEDIPVSDKAKSVKPLRTKISSRRASAGTCFAGGKNFTGKFYCRINILLLIYY